MNLKKYTVFFLLAVFLIARVEPVFPYLKVLPQLTQNLVVNFTSFCTGTQPTNVLADIDIQDDDEEDEDDSTKSDDKECEKEVGKSIKEECKMLLYDSIASAIFNQNTQRTLFHLYLSGKERIHTNEVFRPPLV